MPVCPRCGWTEAYEISTRRKFKCAACHHQFSVTSGTIFASRKMAFVDLLAAICIFVNGAKGISALQLSRDLDCQYKTAFVLSHKLREAMACEVHTGELLDGFVEVDGAYFGGHIRPENYEADRIDRRLAKHQTGRRRVVVAFRERLGRTVPFVTKSEADGVELAKLHVDRMAINVGRRSQPLGYACTPDGTLTVSTTRMAYSDHGKHTNWVESYFSRLRRMVARPAPSRLAASISTSTPITRHGWRTIASGRTARTRMA